MHMYIRLPDYWFTKCTNKYPTNVIGTACFYHKYKHSREIFYIKHLHSHNINLSHINTTYPTPNKISSQEQNYFVHSAPRRHADKYPNEEVPIPENLPIHRTKEGVCRRVEGRNWRERRNEAGSDTIVVKPIVSAFSGCSQTSGPGHLGSSALIGFVCNYGRSGWLLYRGQHHCRRQ